MLTVETRFGSPTIRGRSAVREPFVYRHIGDVDPTQWDSLLGPEDLQLSHRFIRACQLADVERASYRFVLIEDTNGLACVAALSSFDVRLELLASQRLRTTVRRMRHWYENFLRVRVLFCGLPVSFGRPCIRFRQDADRRRCIQALESVIVETSREFEVPLVCWKEFDASEAAGVDSLRELGYVRAASLPSSRLAVQWASFEEYVAKMRSPYRRQIRQAQRVAREAGLTFRTVQNFASCCDEVYGLYEEVMNRAEFQLERLNLAFFQMLNQEFPREASIILAEEHGTPVAAAVLLDSPALCAFLLAGIKYSRNRVTGAYINLVTEVVAHAIRRGATALEMGQTSYDIKRRLGACTTSRCMYLRHRSRPVHEMLRRAGGIVFPTRTYPARRVFRNGACAPS